MITGAAQVDAVILVVALNKADTVEDPELLALVELEVRTHMSQYTISGRGTVVTGAVERGSLGLGDPVEVVGLGPTVASVATGLETFGKALVLPASVTPRCRFAATFSTLTAAEGCRQPGSPRTIARSSSSARSMCGAGSSWPRAGSSGRVTTPSSPSSTGSRSRWRSGGDRRPRGGSDRRRRDGDGATRLSRAAYAADGRPTPSLVLSRHPLPGCCRYTARSPVIRVGDSTGSPDRAGHRARLNQEGPP